MVRTKNVTRVSEEAGLPLAKKSSAEDVKPKATERRRKAVGKLSYRKGAGKKIVVGLKSKGMLAGYKNVGSKSIKKYTKKHVYNQEAGETESTQQQADNQKAGETESTQQADYQKAGGSKDTEQQAVKANAKDSTSWVKKCFGDTKSKRFDRHFLDGRHRFVYDLFKATYEAKNARFEIDLPETAENYMYFDDSNKRLVQKYVRLQWDNLKNCVKDKVGDETDMEAYFACRQGFEEEFKPDNYSETGFLLYCSAIAYMGNYFGSKKNFVAWECAFKYVYGLLLEVLKNSKHHLDLRESSW